MVILSTWPIVQSWRLATFITAAARLAADRGSPVPPASQAPPHSWVTDLPGRNPPPQGKRFRERRARALRRRVMRERLWRTQSSALAREFSPWLTEKAESFSPRLSESVASRSGRSSVSLRRFRIFLLHTRCWGLRLNRKQGRRAPVLCVAIRLLKRSTFVIRTRSL